VTSILRETGVRESRVCAGRGIDLDLGDFYSGEVKKGIGSSAAGTAAVMGLLRVLADGTVGRRDVLGRRCAGVHRDLQNGRGSGADAAACCRGGAIRFRMPATLVPAALPAWLRCVAVSLGGTTRTTPVLERHASLLSDGDDAVARNLEVFAEAADRIMDGLARGDWHGIRLGVNLSAAGYEELSDLLGTELVTSRDARVMRASRRLDGVSRPTGAGGGDLHLAYFDNDANARRFAEWASSCGYGCIPVTPDPAGVCLVSSPARERA
jgi:phosphomevalonate kinase